MMRWRSREAAPPFTLVLLLRSQASDLVNVGTIDADVVQLAVGISRKLLQDIPIYAACAQKACKRELLHGGLLCSTALLTRPRPNEPEEFVPSPRPAVLKLLQCRSQWCNANISVKMHGVDRRPGHLAPQLALKCKTN